MLDESNNKVVDAHYHGKRGGMNTRGGVATRGGATNRGGVATRGNNGEFGPVDQQGRRYLFCSIFILISFYNLFN